MLGALLLTAVLPAVPAASSRAAQFQAGPRLSLPSVPLSAPLAPLASPSLPVLAGAAPTLPTLGGMTLPAPPAGSAALPAGPAALPAVLPAGLSMNCARAHSVDNSGRQAAPAAANDAGQPSAGRPSAESRTQAGMERFDGGGPRAPGEDDSEWSVGRFESAAGGTSIAYKTRAGSARAPARVYAGGLALNESFDPLLAAKERWAGHEYFVWTRAHRPSGWTPTQVVIDADARDLARMIVKAAASTKTGKVEVALHSFGTLVFQRLVQLRGEPEIDAALDALSGSRVFLLDATTHYTGSERRAGPELEQMGTATKQFVDWLNLMDATAAEWEALAKLNPFLYPAMEAWLSGWRAQRAQVLSMASTQAATMMKKDLETPWPPEIDAIRRRFVKALEKDHQDPAWQEALLRRSADMFRLEFTKNDVAAIRKRGIHLTLVHAAGDQLLSWGSAATLFELLGVPVPDRLPPVGTVLHDKSGLFTVRVVDGDHYFPLKKRDELARVMAP